MVGTELLKRVRVDRRLRRAAIALGLLNILALTVGFGQASRVEGSLVGDVVFVAVTLVLGLAVWGMEVWLLSLFLHPPRQGDRLETGGAGQSEGLLGSRATWIVLVALSGSIALAGWIALAVGEPPEAYAFILAGVGTSAAGWAAIPLLPNRWRRPGVLGLTAITAWIAIATVALVTIAQRIR